MCRFDDSCVLYSCGLPQDTLVLLRMLTGTAFSIGCVKLMTPAVKTISVVTRAASPTCAVRDKY